jgi:hypothetical protein
MDMSFNPSGAFAPTEIGGGLTPMTWGGLCARIAAAQDLRRAMAAASAGEETISTGSFHGRAARIIATGFSGVSTQSAEGECLVNPVSSANGKADLGTTIRTEGRFAAGPR